MAPHNISVWQTERWTSGTATSLSRCA